MLLLSRFPAVGVGWRTDEAVAGTDGWEVLSRVLGGLAWWPVPVGGGGSGGGSASSGLRFGGGFHHAEGW